MDKIQVKKVETKREMNDFIRFAEKLYAGCPYYVPDLEMDVHETFDPRKNAGLEFSDIQPFIAYDTNGNVVGRIAGIINHRANEKWKTKNVRFGFIEFVDDPDVSAALLHAVEMWGKERGMEHIQGPMGIFDFDKEVDPSSFAEGDRVEVHFDMEPRVVKAHRKVEADRGLVAVERGPLVYCAEWPDNDFDLTNMLVNRQPEFETVERPDLLYGLTEIRTDAQVLGYDSSGRLTVSDVELHLIPYYAWAHRGTGHMKVWLPQEVGATSPSLPATLASESKLDASHKTTALPARSA